MKGRPNTCWLTMSSATLRFSPVTYFQIDGTQAYNIQVQPAVSSDPHYSGRDGDDVALTNTDNDVAGILVAPTAGLVVVPRTGHTLTSEEPEKFNAALDEFFAEAERGTWLSHKPRT